jgi:Bax protein
MLLTDLINEDDLLNEISFKKTLGTAALGLGLMHGANSLYNYANPPAPNLTPQVAPINAETDEINTQDVNKAVNAIDRETPESPQSLLTSAELKKDFILKVKPLIDKQNAQIISDRKFLISINGYSHLNNAQHSRFQRIAKQYGTNDIKELLVRVDIVPETLTLAQAALESGWGQSQFAQNGDSLFGQKASRDSNNFASYDSYSQSIAAYMHNLNTNPAYSKFRNARYYMRKHGDSLNATLLARTLVAYDITGKAYTKKVSNMINHVIPKAEQLAMD